MSARGNGGCNCSDPSCHADPVVVVAPSLRLEVTDEWAADQ